AFPALERSCALLCLPATIGARAVIGLAYMILPFFRSFGQGRVELGTGDPPSSYEPEKEKRDHESGQRAIGQIVAEHAPQQRRQGDRDAYPPDRDQQRAGPFRIVPFTISSGR